jgi:hypothetical protein
VSINPESFRHDLILASKSSSKAVLELLPLEVWAWFFLFTIMPSLAQHPFGWHYIFIRLMTGLIRLAVKPMQRRARRLGLIHEGVTFTIMTVPSRDTGRDIKVHLYQSAGRVSTKPAPVLVNWHGSVNYVELLCCTKTYDLLLTALDLSYLLSAKIVNFVLLSPLAPSV